MVDTMLHFNNDNLSSNFLSKDELRTMCPKAFCNEPTNPNLSKHYVQANTEMVIDDLAKLGWQPVAAQQCRAKSNSSGIRSFHMVAFQNPDVKLMRKAVGSNDEGVVEAFPRIILTNSHDGFNSFKFMVGLYRLVCSNGVIVATENFAEISIKHINYDFEELRKMVAQVIVQVEEQAQCMSKMLQTDVTDEQAKKLAESAIRIHKGIGENEKLVVDDDILNNMITPTRKEDVGNDLWRRFNVIQENIMQGNFATHNAKGKLRKARPIKSITRNIEVNKQLFTQAYALCA